MLGIFVTLKSLTVVLMASCLSLTSSLLMNQQLHCGALPASLANRRPKLPMSNRWSEEENQALLRLEEMNQLDEDSLKNRSGTGKSAIQCIGQLDKIHVRMAKKKLIQPVTTVTDSVQQQRQAAQATANTLKPSLPKPKKPASITITSLYWSEGEDAQLKKAVSVVGSNWNKVAKDFFPNKTPQYCRYRYGQIKKKSFFREKWNKVECHRFHQLVIAEYQKADRKLDLDAILRGEKDWPEHVMISFNKIAVQMLKEGMKRSPEECAEEWKRMADPKERRARVTAMTAFTRNMMELLVVSIAEDVNS